MVCPLDWGLGHATRCVPLIREFINEGHRVIIGADKNPLAFLKQEFPNLESIILPGYEVEYDEKGSTFKLFYESVKFYNYIKKEKQLLDSLLQEHHIDMIVSDNRYGLYSKKVESIIITHQLYPKTPVGASIAHKKIEQLLGNFDEVWIPDYQDQDNLSGDLSHLNPITLKHRFIGPLSRFKKPDASPEIEYDLCAILSGPEPQRTIFEERVKEQIKQHNLNAVVVRGLPDESDSESDNVFNHLPTQQLSDLILKSKYVVCRSGYSSIMDLTILQKKALLIPTPGQTEQEYLGELHKVKPLFLVQHQNQIDLKVLL